MLVVIIGLENWRHFLENTKFKFKIQIDYKNLEYFMKVQKLNRRQVQQALYLSRFNFILKHVLETKTSKINRLSKKLNQKIGVEKEIKVYVPKDKALRVQIIQLYHNVLVVEYRDR